MQHLSTRGTPAHQHHLVTQDECSHPQLPRLPARRGRDAQTAEGRSRPTSAVRAGLFPRRLRPGRGGAFGRRVRRPHRVPAHDDAAAARFPKGRTSIVYRNGEKVDAARERDKAKWSNWDGSNMDPDSVARHNRSLRRAGFRDNAHAKGSSSNACVVNRESASARGARRGATRPRRRGRAP